MLRRDLWLRVTRHDRARYLCLPCLARRLRRRLCAYEFALTPQEILARMWLHDPDLRLTRSQRRRLLRCAELRRPLGQRQQDLARIGRHYPLHMH